MTRVKSIVLLCVLSGSSSGWSQPLPARFTQQDSGVLLQATGAVVSLPACRGVVWEAFDPATERFLPVPSPPCGASAPPIRLDQQGLRFDPPRQVARPAQVRVTALVGTGCRTDRPFAIAACQQAVFLVSPPISLPAPTP